MVCGCSAIGRSGSAVVPAGDACDVVYETLAGGGLADSVDLVGRATIDVDQYRVRGTFHLGWTPSGDVVFEITSRTLIGGHREDAVFSLYHGTVRLLDRERGEYYEGAEVDDLVADALDVPVDVAAVVRRLTGRPPACARLSDVRVRDGSDRVDGRLAGESFRIEKAAGRVVRGEWPLARHDGRKGGRLEVDYQWQGDSLVGMTIRVPEQGWRVKLRRQDK